MSVTFGTPVIQQYSASADLAALAIAGVTSGQPLILTMFNGSGGAIPAFTDTFATPYTWTQIVRSSYVGGCGITTFIGTGGAGTSGAVSSTGATGFTSWSLVACIGASTAAGADAIDSSNSAVGTSKVPSVGVTPVAAGGGAVYAAVNGNGDMNAQPGAPWSSTYVLGAGFQLGSLSLYVSPPSGTLLTATWGEVLNEAWAAAGIIVLAGGAPPNNSGMFLTF